MVVNSSGMSLYIALMSFQKNVEGVEDKFTGEDAL
jgi:hypothetical protein